MRKCRDFILKPCGLLVFRLQSTLVFKERGKLNLPFDRKEKDVERDRRQQKGRNLKSSVHCELINNLFAVQTNARAFGDT